MMAICVTQTLIAAHPTNRVVDFDPSLGKRSMEAHTQPHDGEQQLIGTSQVGVPTSPKRALAISALPAEVVGVCDTRQHVDQE